MSIRDDATVPPHRLGRGLLVGVLTLVAVPVTVASMVFFGYAWWSECEGSDTGSAPAPRSSQANMCNAWDGNTGLLFWVVPGIALVVAVVVGIWWTRGRIHGIWIPIAVAALVLSPLLIFKALTWPSDTPNRPADHERTQHVAGRR
jgi:hypothetical protein